MAALGTVVIVAGCSASGPQLGSLTGGQAWPVGAPTTGLGETAAITSLQEASPASVERAASENPQVSEREALRVGEPVRTLPISAHRAADGSDRDPQKFSPGTSKVPAQVARAVDRAVAPDARSKSGLRKGGGYYKVGKPYVIAGITYVPRVDPDYEETGVASWYGEDFHGKPTANGEIFDMEALSAAHRTLPLPSYAYVTNLDNGRSLMVRINNRGPFAKGRVIDVSARVARELGFAHKGVANVKVTYAGPAPLDGRDDREEAHLAQSRSGG